MTKPIPQNLLSPTNPAAAERPARRTSQDVIETPEISGPACDILPQATEPSACARDPFAYGKALATLAAGLKARNKAKRTPASSRPRERNRKALARTLGKIFEEMD